MPMEGKGGLAFRVTDGEGVPNLQTQFGVGEIFF